MQRLVQGLIWFWRRRFLKVFTIYGHGSHLDQWTVTISAIFLSPAPRRLHMKFEQYWPRCFRGEVIWHYQHFFHTNAYRSKLDLAIKRSNVMYDHYFSNFGRPPLPYNLCKDSAPRHPLFWRRRFLKVFTKYWHGSHLGKWTATILAIFNSPAPRRLHMKFEQHWPRGFRGEVVWNSQHFPHTNVWRLYKCKGEQT